MKIVLITVCMAFSLFFTSCHDEVQCENGPLNIYFKGFQLADIDTLILRKYSANSNFTQRIDTTFIVVNYGASYIFRHDTTIVSPFGNLNAGYDWQLFIPAQNRTIQITEIRTEQKSVTCGGGLFNQNKIGCYCWNPVFSFKKDGQLITVPNPAEPILFIQ